jgi:hypothetical protein
MAEREAFRTREAEARKLDYYELLYNLWAQARERAQTGQVVIKGKEQPWEQTRQAWLKHYLHPCITHTAVQGWLLFINDIRSHSGRHRHQGGLAIFVLEGKGWTVVDGVRYDWEEGDLILLPIKPHGVEHQHFNAQPGKPCKWLAFIYTPYVDALGNELEQKEVSPDWTHV